MDTIIITYWREAGKEYLPRINYVMISRKFYYLRKAIVSVQHTQQIKGLTMLDIFLLITYTSNKKVGISYFLIYERSCYYVGRITQKGTGYHPKGAC